MRRVIALVILMLFLPQVSSAEQDTYYSSQVVVVIEGDIIELLNGEVVRLIGIDAPELDTAEGQEAKQYLKDLGILYSNILLKFGEQKYDRFGRLLAYAFFELSELEEHDLKPGLEKHFYYNEHKNVFLNATIIKAGYALPLNIPPNERYADFFRHLHKEAKADRRGLFFSEEEQEVEQHHSLDEVSEY